ncbi:unnamed protein product [Heligmosomoides polygyrus]|uniref:Dynein_C domain-containing protein n=1 Tax=Heligmosomoides polygyrus TaxID=6339 RepID=A0A183FKG6_HELPZ|nr:unnamed protein product [Heligmosomoides polygyrus]
MGWDLGMSNELWGWQLGPFYLDHWMSWILAKMASEKRVTESGSDDKKMFVYFPDVMPSVKARCVRAGERGAAVQVQCHPATPLTMVVADVAGSSSLHFASRTRRAIAMPLPPSKDT